MLPQNTIVKEFNTKIFWSRTAHKNVEEKKKQEIEFVYNDLTISEKQYIYTFIKSNIARLIWDNSEFYQCINENDPVVNSAIEVLKSDKIASF